MFNFLRLAILSFLLWQVTSGKVNSTEIRVYPILIQLVDKIEYGAQRSSKGDKKESKHKHMG